MADYGLYTDQDLAERLKAGDHSAFAEIYNRYKFVLHNHAWNKIRNMDEANDALQEVFATLWLKRESINIGSNLSGYLYTSIRNHLLNVIVRKEVRTRYINSIQQFTNEDGIRTDHLVRENMLKAAIEREIAVLPPRMREVFELSRKQHLSHKEIAAIMNTSEQTVKKQMTKALKILRSKLSFVAYLYLILFLRY
jgi:RNA polymerase sigma-70 factor (ECF subfamily)